MKEVVVDASLAVKWVLPEPLSEEALLLAERWSEQGMRIVAPPHIHVEVANAIRKRVPREMSEEEAIER